MQIQLLAVPYDSGNARARMGAGPEALLRAGLADALREDGHSVYSKIAELPADAWAAEIGTAFELMRMLSVAVRDAVDADRFPIVLAGNCNTAVGTLAGLGQGTGVAWFDAHGDFNTPETTSSGFLDGTAVATITGRCWAQLASTVPSFAPVPDHAVCLIGTRDVDPLEEALLGESGVDVVRPRDFRARLRPALAAVAEHVDRIYVHIDLDVLDSGVARANSYAVGGGLTLDDMQYALTEIAGTCTIAGAALSAYDPAADTDGRAAAAAIGLLRIAAGLADRR
jgi:arginase